ncbi:hypothetical protein [Truepera radiovictrix]|uniref:hypothetical protein n=1 Tax=Truepera radiovictrix TaxID=332249 RepID=UPI0002E4BAB7|nr:hypothetical protein [Truepera radiovictrix]WMT56147.1 hypothetical protein RCV51_09005 [Truepera radiovictrix]
MFKLAEAALSLEEYLAREREGDVRHECVGGYETEPCILVEVLSPSTRMTDLVTDLREKLTAYKSLPTSRPT